MAGTDLKAGMTGQAAQVLDQQESSEKGMAIIGGATIVLILVLLLVIFRSPVIALLPIVVIGAISSMVNGMIAMVAKAFDLQIDASISAILLVVLFGVGTDYILFLMFRYRERLRAGEDPKTAMVSAVTRVGEAITSAVGVSFDSRSPEPPTNHEQSLNERLPTVFATLSGGMLTDMTSAASSTSLWLRGDNPKPGPRPAYTLDQLADVGVRLADLDGLRALSMRRIADELGTAAASLYRYVDGKNDLIALMVDHVAAEYDYPPLTGNVRTDVFAMLDQARALHQRHPWLREGLGEVASLSSNLGPNSIRFLDRMVGALASAGLDANATMMGVSLLSGWVRTFTGIEAAGFSAPVMDASDHPPAMLAHGDYPHLTRLLATAESETAPVDNDAVFRAGVEALLFGIVR
ncbi:MMPL family transporter [Nocardia sp. CA-084685]|uniref:MMPL family transporter n=1 Tax=Nocardia sp. CA-084685 TaxID=3239970 RepID=UPI003D95B5CE